MHVWLEAALQSDQYMTSKHRESDLKTSGESALCSSHCTSVSHSHRSAALLQVEHTSYSVGKGAVLGGVIESRFSTAQKLLIMKMVKNCLTV